MAERSARLQFAGRRCRPDCKCCLAWMPVSDCTRWQAWAVQQNCKHCPDCNRPLAAALPKKWMALARPPEVSTLRLYCCRPMKIRQEQRAPDYPAADQVLPLASPLALAAAVQVLPLPSRFPPRAADLGRIARSAPRKSCRQGSSPHMDPPSSPWSAWLASTMDWGAACCPAAVAQCCSDRRS